MTTILASFLLLSASLHKDTSIRSTDWERYFRTDTSTYAVDNSIGSYGSSHFAVSFKDAEEDGWGGGFPDLEYLTYGDLDGDGVEEAEISFYTGGSAGSCSYAILRNTSEGPRTIYIGYGYKVGSVIENDTLKIYQPIPTDYDPNCCQQSMRREHYRIVDNKVTLVDSFAYGQVQHAHIAVREFYKLLGAKDYDGAYSLLSPKYQRKHPYSEWRKGFNNTLSTTALDDDFSYPSEIDTTVTVKLTSVDLVNGKHVSQMFAGTWKLVWSGLDEGWLLDEPKIRKMK